MGYSTGCHTTFHQRYHLVWTPKYRFKVLHGEEWLQVRQIIRQVCSEMGMTIINGALSRDHVPTRKIGKAEAPGCKLRQRT